MSDSQPTTYPNCPSDDNPPTDEVIGGFLLDAPTCTAWGTRISKRDVPLDPNVKNDCLRAVWNISNIVEEKPYNVLFGMVGAHNDVSEVWYMVITQKKAFNGWHGMDPGLIPQFEEGKGEVRVRELLEAEGVHVLRVELI
ncbi:hypothetical protein BDN70DRAFT_800731 [Pholiota conissans]|uniref:Uncharacterized protein n=1 Tax=Pholiota conissans TaxID=109636 RepID=A0A9P6CXF6_9AGAR|nr:hypothetical protein BDN70DRAFT_800731 [Pholiota conissans]